jgi:hypothetical protein
VRRCHRRDVDVGAELLGTNKARQKPKSEHARQCPKIWSKNDSQKLSKFLSRERRIFMSKGQMDVQRGIMVLNGDQKVTVKTEPADVGGCIPALAGVTAGFSRSMSRRLEAV